MAQSAGTSPGESDGAGAGRFAGSFAEVEVGLDEGISLGDISSLPRAPGGEMEVLDDGMSVRVQLPTESVEALIEQGAEITVLREFILMEGGATEGSAPKSDVSPLTVCSGNYIDADSPLDVYIVKPWPTYYGSLIDFSSVPGGYTVSCIDVHYEVRNLLLYSTVDVALSDENYMYLYTLVNGWLGLDGDIVQTRTGITAFNGKALNQIWVLWATDYYANGRGYIDYWWIKLYCEMTLPIQVAMKFTPQALNPAGRGTWVKAHFVLPEGFVVEDVNASSPARIEPGCIESEYLNVFVNEDGLVEIEAAFDRAEFCGLAPGDQTMEVTVVGWLASGQQFYGTDTIKITNNGPKFLAGLASYWLAGDCSKPDWCGGFDLDQDSVVNFVDLVLFDGCCIEVVSE
jgi:hypothetical protein